MTVTAATLAAQLRHRAEVAAITDPRQRALAVSWLRSWDKIAADLQAVLERQAEHPTTSGAARAAQLRESLAIVADRFETLCIDAGQGVVVDVQQVAAIADGHADELFRTQLAPGMDVPWRQTDPRQLQAIVGRVTQQVTARYLELSAAAQVAMREALVSGVAAGLSPRETARRMVATVGAEFNGGLARANVIARTETLDAYRTAATEAHRRNADVLRGWQWVCALGKRTCRSCVSHHGEIHDLDEPGPLDHQQGRCARVPLAKTWAELGFPGIPEPGPTVQPGDGVRWLQQQDEATQRHILGRDGFDAWKAGDYPPERWSQRRHTDGWRDSYGVAPAPTATARAAAAEARELAAMHPLDMTRGQLEAEVARLIDAGDYGPRMEDVAAQLDRLDHAERMEARERETAEWQRSMRSSRTPTGAARPATRADQEAQLRAEYDAWCESHYRRAEEATNGFMLTREADARGITPRQLLTDRRYSLQRNATPELQEWLAANPRISWRDFQAEHGGDLGAARGRRERRGRETEYGG